LVFNRGSNVYRTTIANLLAKVDNEIFEVVNPLPTTGVANKIYLVPSSDPETQNALDEYIWVDGAWEKIGAVSVDLSNMLDGKQDKLVAGDNITIDENTNTISASAEVDPSEIAYFNYASSFYGDKYSLLVSAWEHSLTLGPSDIKKSEYPNGETEGVIIPQGITIIASNAFSYWTSNNQPLVIPNSVTTIWDGAFFSWSSNTYPLVIPEGVTAIYDSAFTGWSSNRHPIIIPSSVTSIGAAFNYWLKVPYVEIHATTPPTLASSQAFADQNNAPIYVPDGSVEAYKAATNWVYLADRIFPISDKSTSVSGGGEVDLNEMTYFNFASSIYGDKYNLLVSAWEHSQTVNPLEISEDSELLSPRGKAQYPNGKTEGVIIPQGVTTIGANAFNNVLLSNQELVLVIPNSVTSIGDWAFGSWKANNNPLVIPDSVTSIGNSAFSGWEANNKPLAIPNSLTSIGNSAFSGWSSNTYPLVIPKSVTSIGNLAFSGWLSNNQPLVIPKSVTSIGGSAFDGWTSNTHPLVIPNSVISIGDQAFYAWSSNNQPLVIPESVTSIGINTFRSWSTNNHPLVIPDSVTSIDMSAFRGWSSNTHPIIIPNSVTTIGKEAFVGWSLVPYVEMKAITPPTLAGSDAFDGQNNAPIYVPDESVTVYKTATNWVNLADRIFPISDMTDDSVLSDRVDDLEVTVGNIDTILDSILGV